jgi:putative transposase
MTSSCTYLYVHLVWSTKYRRPMIGEALGLQIPRLLVAKTRELGCIPLAVTCMPDHVHMAVRMVASVSPALLVGQLKGLSSFRVNQERSRSGLRGRFGWQEGYGAFSFDGRETPLVAQYIRGQRTRHAAPCRVAPQGDPCWAREPEDFEPVT